MVAQIFNLMGWAAIALAVGFGVAGFGMSMQNSATMSSMNATLAAVDTIQNTAITAVNALVQEVAMTAMNSVTANITLVNSGALRWFSSCRSDFLTIVNSQLWADFAGLPESTFSTSKVVTSFNLTIFVVTINPPVDPIVQTAKANPDVACATWLAADQPYWFSARSEPNSYYTALVQIPDGTVYLDPACSGEDCVVKSSTQVEIIDSIASYPSPPFMSLSQWGLATSPRDGEDPFVTRSLYMTEPFHVSVLSIQS
jgi:hypothetical protein